MINLDETDIIIISVLYDKRNESISVRQISNQILNYPPSKRSIKEKEEIDKMDKLIRYRLKKYEEQEIVNKDKEPKSGSTIYRLSKNVWKNKIKDEKINDYWITLSIKTEKQINHYIIKSVENGTKPDLKAI